MLASRLRTSTKYLVDFDDAIRFFRRKPHVSREPKEEEMLLKLMQVIQPIISNFLAELTESTAFSEYQIVLIMQNRHEDWVHYKQKLQKLSSKLSSSDFTFDENDFEILDDIGDALDAECAIIFERISERR